MRHFVLKLSDGFYYRSGHAVGQQFHLADIYPESEMEKMLRDLVHIKENIDNGVQLTEIIIAERNMMKH